jgi:molybdate transport system substrate-binding protein
MRRTLLLLLLLAAPLRAQEPLRVAVAANFRATLERINAPFQRQTGQRIVLSSASTGVLYSQILHGAPFDLFLAADDRAPARLHAAGRGAAPFCYAVGTLALAGGDLSQLADPARSLAIANPATAPYGEAALEVLEREAFRAGSTRKLVRGNNVVQAYQFWRGGVVDLALVAGSLAPREAAPVPAAWHRPLLQHALLLETSEAASAYLKWLQSDTVRSMITDAGYRPCP